MFLLELYVLIDRVGGPEQKIFGSRSGRTNLLWRNEVRASRLRTKYLHVRPDLLSQQAFYHMTVVFLNFSGRVKTRSWQHLPRFVSPFLAGPYTSSDRGRKTRTALMRDFFLSYGFRRKLRVGPYGSCDNAANLTPPKVK